MSPFYIPSGCILLLIHLALTSALPLQSTALTSEDLDVLKVSLDLSKKKTAQCVCINTYYFIIYWSSAGHNVLIQHCKMSLCKPCNIIILSQLLLSQLEESVPAQTLDPEVEEMTLKEEEVVPQPELLARDFLSARDLKTVRQDSSSKKYSGCFGRRLDRIGSMSTLGCNTVGRHSKLINKSSFYRVVSV